MLFVDLDDFKTVNDSLGHSVGDELLMAVGSRLGGCIRAGDTVARLGGDEFGILLDEVEDSEHPARVAARVIDAMEVAFAVGGRQVISPASVGYALADGGSISEAQLLADADVALYAAKDAGKATLRGFEPSMRHLANERLELGQDLHLAVDDDQIFCDYQPIVDLTNGRIVAIEALARWAHPTRGLISPGTFIDLAEANGTIAAIGQRVLDLSLTQVDRWRRRGEVAEDLELHVNLSGRQLDVTTLVADVTRVLAATDLPAHQLVLEITESVAVDFGARHLDRLAELRAIGMRLAIDDFGTGYSSLNYLRALPVDVLKIDRAFAGTDDGATDAVLLEAIVRLGHSLGIEMIAEGVEREDQAAMLRRLGCRRAQGFLYHRPIAASDIPAVMAAGPNPSSPSTRVAAVD